MTAHSEDDNRIGLRAVPVILKNGTRSVQVNALLDDGSTQTYLNTAVATELGLRSEPTTLTISTLNGQVKTFSATAVEVDIASVDGDLHSTLSARTIDRVTGDLQVVNWKKHGHSWRHLKNIDFPRIGRRSHIDLLIGLDHAELHRSLGEVQGQVGEPIARLTPLGWTCVGPTTKAQPARSFTGYAHTFFVQSPDRQLDKLVRQFWAFDGDDHLNTRKTHTDDERAALDYVAASLNYHDTRYEVTVPWKSEQPPEQLPDSFQTALRRLEQTERKLNRDPTLGEAYGNVFRQYLEKGYIQEVLQDSKPAGECWYLPHFAVVRADKVTTKTRVVFDAAATTGGVSLNNFIHSGPKLQRELFDVLVRFRREPIAVACDISEMYLQVKLAVQDRPYHRFLWRDLDPSIDPKIYEFQRVVFGVNASPFMAQYVTQEHARRHATMLPLAAETVLDSTYMDDSLTSVADENEGCDLYQQLSLLWKRAGMHARKWLSNSTAVLALIPPSDRAAQLTLESSELPSVKTLGILWEASNDVFTFSHKTPPDVQALTKRTFLKKIASLFDPLGLLAPFTVRAKVLLQSMWISGYDWDDEVDPCSAEEAREWFAELSNLAQVRVPRCLRLATPVESSALHVFVDASEKAFGAACYVRHEYSTGEITSRLIASKAKVAPLTATSIPRLELMGAVVGSRLAINVSAALKMHIGDTVLWTDSMNVLYWLRNASRHFKPFVAHRVGEIQTTTAGSHWRHVPTKFNPADLLTRGLRAEKMAEHSQWWDGPSFLSQPEDAWPSTGVVHVPPSDVREEKSPTRFCHLSVATIEALDRCPDRLEPERFSSWTRLIRTTAWVMRFINNCRQSVVDRSYGELDVDELQDAEIFAIRRAQRRSFPAEFTALQGNNPLSRDSKLMALHPCLDDSGVIRSCGRLQHAKTLSMAARQPIILPRNDPVTKLIIRDQHEKLHHVCGTNQTLAALSTRYWIMSARVAIREWQQECNHCARLKAKQAEQIMAPLPESRVSPSLCAFERTSVDFAGPFLTKQGRGKARVKRYMCLFTCMATRAVHIEVAFGLDTDSFMNALVRMVGRRGRPKEITSDNGTNFVGAVRELKELVDALDSNKIQAKMTSQGIKWVFNPPAAPHFGGVHESLVKSAKRAAYAIISGADVSDEELLTCFIGVEALLNSRPLTYASDHPTDEPPLTPKHFLHGELGGELAPEAADSTPFNPRRRWRYVQEVLRQFWRRWMTEWLPALAPRRKWRAERRDLAVGDVVIVATPESPRGHWPLGRVIEVFPGRDGHVRVAKLQVGEKVIVRPISKLCPLHMH